MSNFNPASSTTHDIASRKELWRKLTIVALCSAVIAVASKISVPVWPVPVTLQTLAVAVVAALVGSQLAVATVAAYLMQGLLGLPVFAGGGGLAYLFGPTGGFLIAYFPMAYIIGRAAESGLAKRPFVLLGAMLGADAMVIGLGFMWLLASAGAADWIDPSDPIGSAWRGAVEPFLVWDALKMAMGACMVWALSERSHSEH